MQLAARVICALLAWGVLLGVSAAAFLHISAWRERDLLVLLGLLAVAIGGVWLGWQ